MNALLGKIVSIAPKENAPDGNLVISLKPICILPARAGVPEWLKDQVLKLEREVVDQRELGYPGDSIILTPAESGKWLYPLQITPDLVYGEMPKSIRIDLRWWKSDDAPEYTVRANARTITGKFNKEDGWFWAEVETSQFYPSAPQLPVDFEISCDKLNLACTVMPGNTPVCRKLVRADGEVHRMENSWYAMDVTAKMHSGAILSIIEKGRKIDHFRRPSDTIAGPLDSAGHTDRIRRGWGRWGQVVGNALASSGTRREADSTILRLDGVADEGANMRTSVSYALYDDIPLVTLDRSYQFTPGKKKEEDKDKPEAPKQPIDDIASVGLAFRAGSLAEKNGRTRSRILCARNGNLVTMRPARREEHVSSRNWRLDQGWAIIEHPGRHECMMYLFDPKSLPIVSTWLGAYEITLEPFWLQLPIKPEDYLGYTLAITAGELCGAQASGGWVACRMALPDGGVRCGVIARTKECSTGEDATFKVGSETRNMPMVTALIPGLGSLCYAVADFAEAEMTDEFDVTAAGIASRRIV